MRAVLTVVLVGALVTGAPAGQFDYPTPKGTPTENGLAGFAKILCSAVFVSGRDANEAARNSAYFFMPRGEQADVTFDVRHASATVSASRAGITRQAKFHGDQGCIIENPDTPGIHFTPVAVRSSLPDAATTPWPMGDAPATGPLHEGVDVALMNAALDAAFADPAALT